MSMNWRFSIKQAVFLCIIGFLLAGCYPYRQANGDTPGELRIHDIQGCSHQSPYRGKEVSDLQGIVTRKVSNGFYIQDDQVDDQLCSSEALFVFTGSYPDVLPEDLVIVSGVVDEYQPGVAQDHNLSLTQLIDPNIRVLAKQQPMPEAVLIGKGGLRIPDKVIDDDGLQNFEPTQDGIDFYESLESMLVSVESGIVVGSRNKYNEVVIIPDEVGIENFVSFTGALIEQEFDSNPERIILNLNDENREPIHVGARLVKKVTGVLDYSYGNYKVNVFGLAHFTSTIPEITSVENPQDTLSILTYNVENLSRFDESKIRSLAKEISKILDHPDLIVLNEILDDSGIENDGEVSSDLTLSRLVEAIEATGGVYYRYIDNPPINNQDGGIEGGNIRSIILYKEADLQIAQPETGNLSENPNRIGPEEWPFSVTRKPLVALFDYGDQQFLVVAVHLTSRGADTPLFGNIQPIERPEQEKRIAQAAYIRQYLEKIKQHNPQIPIIVVGDFNDDPWSQTVETLMGDLLVDTGNSLPENERFSFVMDGNAVQLDYILFSQGFDWVYSQQIIHLNTVLDHNRRISDHDPVLTFFTMP